MKYILKLFFAILLVTLRLEASNPYEIVAVVDNIPILEFELEERFRLTTLGNTDNIPEEQKPQIKKAVLKQIINEYLQFKEAQAFSIDAEAHDIDNFTQDLANNNYVTKEAFLEKIAKAQISEKTFKEYLRHNIAWIKFIHTLKSALVDNHETKQLDIGKEDLQQKIADLKNSKNTSYLLYEIVLPFRNEIEKMQLQEHANSIYQQLLNGADFSAVAQQTSTAPSALHGGYIDWVDEKILPQDLQKVLQNLEINSVTPPIIINNNYIIYKLAAKQKKQGNQESLYSFTIVSLEKMDATLKEKLHKAENCPAFRNLSDSLAGAQTEILENVQAKELPQFLHPYLDTLELNKLIGPIETPYGHKFAMACHFKKAQEVPINTKELKQKLLEIKFEELLQKRLRDMKRRAHIEIRI